MKKRFNTIIPAIILALTVCAFVYFLKPKNTVNLSLVEKAKLLENKQIPNFPILEVGTNTNYADEIQKGEFLIVYMLSDCEACRKETEIISQIQADTDTKFLGVVFEDEAVVKNYVKNHNLKFPVLIDKDKTILQNFALQDFPANLKVKDGAVQKALFGLPVNADKLLEFAKKRD